MDLYFSFLYINDLSKIMKYCKVSLYADDTVIYIEHNDVQIALQSMQSDLNNLMGWCTDNKVTINCKKNKYCIYGMRANVRRSKSLDTILSLSNNRLDRVSSYKYLGFILDEHLNFNKHVSELCNIVSHKLFLMSKIRKFLTSQACITIFKTMVLSVIEYGDIIYTGTSARNLDRIDRLFYRGLRICLGNDAIYTRDELCTKCNISNLAKRRDLHLLLYMHKQSANLDLLNIITRTTRLHRARVFWHYKPNNEKARLNVLYRGAILWNNLPAAKRNMEFLTFKTWLKREMYVIL